MSTAFEWMWNSRLLKRIPFKMTFPSNWRNKDFHLAESRTFCSFHTILLVPPRNYHFGENSRNIIFFVRNKQGEAKKRIETIMWINQRAEWENILNGTYKGWPMKSYLIKRFWKSNNFRVLFFVLWQKWTLYRAFQWRWANPSDKLHESSVLEYT